VSTDQHELTLELLSALLGEVPAEQRGALQEQLTVIPSLLAVEDADAAEDLIIALLDDAHQRRAG
jgi:DNA-binding protein YbaB